VKAAAFGAFMNAGQICMSTERIIVVEAIADEFARKLGEKASGMPSAAVGPQFNQAAESKVKSLIADALAKGARQLSSGAAKVIDNVTATMSLYRDESFGPVVGITRVADEEEAIRVANDSEYGLSASVFTSDAARGLRVARRIRSGICHVNGPTVQDEPQMPFGGLGALRLWQIRREGGDRSLYGTAVDHDCRRIGTLSDLGSQRLQ
jgi:acyl-CoA reductase-like NAD-dependent aldehyde dehydrogenase